MMDKILNNPFKLIGFTVIVVISGYCIQKQLAHYKYRAHASGPHLAKVDPIVIKGQEIYARQGCHYCHTQNLRPLPSDVLRYSDEKAFGNYQATHTVEQYFDTPSVKGSARIGPDLSRISTRYTTDDLKDLLNSSEQATLKEAYHNYSALFSEEAQFTVWDKIFLSWKIRGMMNSGLPFSDSFQKSVFTSLDGKTAGDALAAYLANLGRNQQDYYGNYYKK